MNSLGTSQPDNAPGSNHGCERNRKWQYNPASPLSFTPEASNERRAIFFFSPFPR